MIALSKTFGRLFLGSAILFLVLAVILNRTTRSMDIVIHDTYFVVKPGELVAVSLLLFLTTFVTWKASKANKPQ